MFDFLVKYFLPVSIVRENYSNFNEAVFYADRNPMGQNV